MGIGIVIECARGRSSSSSHVFQRPAKSENDGISYPPLAATIFSIAYRVRKVGQ